MTTRSRWVVGNWKQNLRRREAHELGRDLSTRLLPHLTRGGDLRVGIAPSFVALQAMEKLVLPRGSLWLFAQDCAAQESGPHTGEVGPMMLRDVGVHGAIVGHSERRAAFGDTDELVARKLRCALSADMTTIVCVGETLEARERAIHEATVTSQLQAALERLPHEHCSDRLLVAYEPVWAIGTGRTATPDQAEVMHRHIRTWLTSHFGESGADRSILYGGSVKADNVAALAAQPNVDGFLVGGASLDAEAFSAIVRASQRSLVPPPLHPLFPC